MKALLKIVPLTSPPKKGQRVAYENVCKDMEAQDVFEYYGDKYNNIPKYSSMLGRGEIITTDKLFQIVCEYEYYDGMSQLNEQYVKKKIPLHYDDYDSALSRMRTEKGKEVEIKLIDALGMTNHNPDTSVAVLVKDGYNNRSWDDIIQDIAEKHSILIDSRIQEFLEENYYSPKSKKYKE
jgi:hypothetical protein